MPEPEYPCDAAALGTRADPQRGMERENQQATPTLTPADSENGQDTTTTAAPQLIVQLGANWIHGLHHANPLFTLAQRLQLELFQTSSDNAPGDDVLLFDAGTGTGAGAGVGDGADGEGDAASAGGDAGYAPVPRLVYKRAMLRFEWMCNNLGAVMNCEKEGTGEDIVLFAALQQCLQASEVPDLPFGPCNALERRCLNWCFDRIAIDCAAPVNRIGVSHFYDSESDGEHGEAIPLGGTHQLMRFLVSGENGVAPVMDIRLGCEVKCITAVDCDGNTVVITEDVNHCSEATRFIIDCGNDVTFEADCVLCTIPVGVLKADSVVFKPEPRQLHELKALQSGLMTLVWLWYPRQFWPDEFNYFGLAHNCFTSIGDHRPSDHAVTTFLAPPMVDQNGDTQPVLLCQVAGEYAELLEPMTEIEVAKYVTGILRKMFTAVEGGVPEAVGCVHSRWRSDRYSCGAYSVCAVPDRTVKNGNEKETCAEDDSSDGCSGGDKCESSGLRGLFFAGEALHEHSATAHGAFLSGEREAASIIALLEGVSSH